MGHQVAARRRILGKERRMFLIGCAQAILLPVEGIGFEAADPCVGAAVQLVVEAMELPFYKAALGVVSGGDPQRRNTFRRERNR